MGAFFSVSHLYKLPPARIRFPVAQCHIETPPPLVGLLAFMHGHPQTGELSLVHL